jgi:hypothetical protein
VSLVRPAASPSVAVVLLAAVLASPLPARGEDACLSDARRLCSATPPGDGRVYFCLRSSWNQLSDGCRALLDWSQKRANELALDCQADAFAWCQGVPAGKGRLYACLASHHDAISSECKKALATLDWFQSACGADRARLCPQVPVGDGGILACLVTRRDALSPSCQAVFWP